MGTYYDGERAVFVDDNDGTWWTSKEKIVQLDPTTGEEIAKDIGKETITVSVSEPIETKTAIDADNLTCICGFEAKTKAGLAVHKMKAKHGEVTTADFKEG